MRFLIAGLAIAGLALVGCSANDSPADPAADASALPSAAATTFGPGPDFVSTGVTRTYDIAADEVDWNYAPTGRNEITGAPFDDTALTYVGSGPNRIGSTYEKCLYRAYTDDSFATRQQRPDDEAYLGILGPTIRAEVGDTIRVTFRNNCPFPTSMHPHGVMYAKDSEGAPYNDGTSGADTEDDDVPTGGTHVYTWKVPDRAGPGPMDGSSAVWMYHSHSDEIGDVYAGLNGFLIVTARGKAKPDGSPVDVDQEVFSLFLVDNENASPFLPANVDRFVGHRVPDSDEGFEESNLMHSINGFVFGGGPMPTLHKGARVRWYLMAMGTEVDLHTPHWHGNTVLFMGTRTDVVNLLPASMVAADMTPDNVGIWLFHCHVADHVNAGMLARYQVVA